MGFFKRFVKAITNPVTLVMAVAAVALAPATGGASLAMFASSAFWTSVAITAAVMAGAQALSAPPKMPSFTDFVGELQGRTQMIKQPTVPRRMVYGETRVSGVLGFAESISLSTPPPPPPGGGGWGFFFFFFIFVCFFFLFYEFPPPPPLLPLPPTHGGRGRRRLGRSEQQQKTTT